MTSKNSFLANVIENNKRRLWVWVVSLLVFVLVLPIITAFAINGIEQYLNGWIENYGNEQIAQQMVKARLLEVMCGRFGFNIQMCALITITAVVSAVQGFSYLYSRKKIDFYMGMPVKRKKRFFIIWQNGIFLYLAPYFLGTIISLLIAASAGAVDKLVMKTAFVTFGANICFYLCVYHMAILAVMLTGNIVITGFGFLVFCLYEFGIRTMLTGYRQLFFLYFSYYGVSEEPVFSPFTMYGKIASHYDGMGIVDIKYFIFLLLFALAVGALAYICYLKRPAETAGKAMTFAITKPVIKIALVAPASLLSGLVVASIIGFTPYDFRSGIGYMIFTIAFVVVIGSALIQVIYEFDIKGIWHKKIHILVSGVIAAVVFAIFHFDLFGYDSYIPKPEQLESVAFVPSYYEDFGSSFRFDELGNYLSEENYADKYMYLSNKDAICQLADRSITNYNEVRKLYKGGRNMIAAYDETEQERWSEVTIIYRLKSGRKVCRRLLVNVDDEQTIALLDEIIGSKEFKEGYFIGASERLDQLMDDEKYKVSISYGNCVYDRKMGREEAKEFLEVYRRDFAQADFSNVRESIPLGLMRFVVSKEINENYYDKTGAVARSVRSWDIPLKIYPFYLESITWLKDHGYYLEHQLDISDVERIQVLNNNYEISRELRKQMESVTDTSAVMTETMERGYSGDEIDTRVYADYTDKEQLEEIISSIYPKDMIIDDWDRGKTWDNDYVIIVYFNTDSGLTREYGTSAYYGFLEGEVPDFVRVDTTYKE